MDTNNTDKLIKPLTPTIPITGNIIISNPRIMANKLMNLVFI